MQNLIGEDKKMETIGNLLILFTTSLCFYLFVALLNIFYKYWWIPHRVQFIMNSQGIRGPPYEFIHGNNKEAAQMLIEASTKPLALTQDIVPRVMPHVYSWINKYGLVLVLVAASMVGVSLVNKEWGSLGSHPHPHHPHNHTNGPKRIIVGGSQKWHFGVNYSDCVYLLPHLKSFLNCDLRKSKMIANRTQESGNGFEFVLKKWKPYYFACCERNGFHCKVGLMKSAVVSPPLMDHLSLQGRCSACVFFHYHIWSRQRV
ncbi:hypothetical protein CXB51_036029 [Gossypium anomalum]|uniref:Uncharacterized protein n=1 Tax=Gossypium anomalum TaxID=47600 RepID=A0A8J5Y4X8_9ROSI|nr:hypothetical protein CXB51_036029 [Gossypium anomalum]